MHSFRELAKIQYECGAHFLDINAGVAGGNEIDDLCWLVELVQEEVPIPLMIDSANPEALKAALSVYRHSEPPILNSISGEKEKWDQLFPLVTEKKCKVVVLLMDDQGIPKTIEERLGIAKRLYQNLVQANIPPDYIFFDILVLSVAVEPDAALVALETIKTIRSNFPQSHITCGVSNVQHGAPCKEIDQPDFLDDGHCRRPRHPPHRCSGSGPHVIVLCQQSPRQSRPLLPRISKSL